MVDAAALAGARLRKVEAAKDHSAAVLPKANEKEHFDAYFNRVREADLEAWYPKLKHLTYETAFFPISIEEAKAIVARKEEGEKPQPLSGILVALAKSLDEEVLKYGSEGAFAKLSSRSPKDAAVERCHEIYRHLVTEERKRLGHSPPKNWKLIALNRAHIECMKVKNARELLDLFCRSARIEEDLKLALDKPVEFSQKIILRKWMPIPIEYEFRGFVNEKKLNALSQYYVLCYFPHLVEQCDLLTTRIRKFFETDVLPVFPFQSMVVDFAYEPKSDRIFILELNPYNNFDGCGTDPALFHWKNDRHVLDQGPFTFRLEDKERPDLRPLLSAEFFALITEDEATP